MYAHGRVLKKVSSDILIDELFFEIDQWIAGGMQRPKRLKMATPLDVVIVVAPFADVVQQQREHESSGCSRSSNSDANFRAGGGPCQPLEVPDRQQRVLVDRYLWKKSRTTRYVIAWNPGNIRPSRPQSCISDSRA